MRLTLILLLLAANGLFAAWSHDLLAPWWPAPQPAGVQPERVKDELRPQALQLLSPKAAAERAALARAQESPSKVMAAPETGTEAASSPVSTGTPISSAPSVKPESKDTKPSRSR
jgi:hypothetical protein